ncbi:hypothetical protein SAMN04487974_109126 [Pelagibacterium luteolum]|uniref:Uncharacterized protein n=2 Tax=Pelagibacterium luteolum TaxID=440168 RepID=A0A1G7XHK2_9HYPH|nr:hypothetical protein SAMN04487974_109126 [Pelagibacterium luteolum]
MSKSVAQALELAQNVAFMLESTGFGDPIHLNGRTYMPGELGSEFERALATLRQGPKVLDDLGVHAMLRKEIEKVGSVAELARRMNVTRQSLHDVYSGKKGPGPAVLGYFNLNRMGGRTKYELLD